MSEAETFSGFTVRTDGKAVVIFSLTVPEWEQDWSTDNPSEGRLVYESIFDERSLATRIENLRRSGQDASLSEAALQALRQAMATGSGPSSASEAPSAAFVAVVEASVEAVAIAAIGEGGASPRIVYVNSAFTQIMGYTREAILGCNFGLLHAASTAGVKDEIAAALAVLDRKDGGVQQSMHLRTMSGSTLQAETTILPIRASSSRRVTHFAVVVQSIAANAEAQQGLPSDCDPITGLPGRGSLLAAVESALAKAVRGGAAHTPGHGPCLARLSVDGLTTLAGRHAADIGNAVMLGVTDRLAENLRRIDTLARVGADEFAICLPRVAPVDAAAIVYRLCRAVAAAPIETPAGPMEMTLRVGMAEASLLSAQASPGQEKDQASALFTAAGQSLAAAPSSDRQQSAHTESRMPSVPLTS